MSYQLLITMQIGNDPRYTPLLKPFEAVSGIPATFTFSTKNIGEHFPSGKIREVEFSSPLGMTSYTVSQTVDVEIPNLDKGDDFTFKVPSVTLRNSGIYGVSFKGGVEGGGKVEYFQSEREQPVGEGEVIQVFYVVERSLLDIILLLTQLIEKEASTK